MKRLWHFLSATLVGLMVASVVIACANTPTSSGDPLQQAINLTTNSYNQLTLAITSARGAVTSNLLKGQDAVNAGKGFDQAKAGLDTMLIALRSASAAASAASAAPPAAKPATLGAKP